MPVTKLSEPPPNDGFANEVGLVNEHVTPFPRLKLAGGGGMITPRPAPGHSGMSPAPKDGCLGTVCVWCAAHGLLGSPDGGGTIAGGRAPVGNIGLGVAGNWGGNWFEALPPGVLGGSPVVLGKLAIFCA